MLGYALVLYPLIGWLAGHRYPAVPTFGVPCPTTIFTVGVLCFAGPSLPRGVLIVPMLWSVVGTFAALGLGVPQDFGLAVAGAVALSLAVVRRRAPTTGILAPHAR